MICSSVNFDFLTMTSASVIGNAFAAGGTRQVVHEMVTLSVPCLVIIEEGEARRRHHKVEVRAMKRLRNWQEERENGIHSEP